MATKCEVCGSENHTEMESARCETHQREWAARASWNAADGLTGASREQYMAARAAVAESAARWLAAAETDGQRRQAQATLAKWR